MQLKEFKEIIDNRFSSMGFSEKNGIWYKEIDPEYMVAFFMDNSVYEEGYYMYCGYCYLPDDAIFSQYGGIYLDRQWHFYFPKTVGTEIDLSGYDFEKGCVVRGYGHIFEYEEYTPEEFEKIFDENMKYIFEPMCKKGYGFYEYYTSYPSRLQIFGPKKLKKICGLLGIDVKEVEKVLGREDLGMADE